LLADEIHGNSKAFPSQLALAVKVSKIPNLSQGILRQIGLTEEWNSLFSCDEAFVCLVNGNIDLVEFGLV